MKRQQKSGLTTTDRLQIRLMLDIIIVENWIGRNSKRLLRAILLLGAAFLVCVLFMFDW